MAGSSSSRLFRAAFSVVIPHHRFLLFSSSNSFSSFQRILFVMPPRRNVKREHSSLNEAEGNMRQKWRTIKTEQSGEIYGLFMGVRCAINHANMLDGGCWMCSYTYKTTYKTYQGMWRTTHIRT
jgi:hypothetical protein